METVVLGKKRTQTEVFQWVLPAKGPAGLRGSWASDEVRAAVVGTDIPGICQRLGGNGAVSQCHQVTGRLRFGDLERCRNGLNGKKLNRETLTTDILVDLVLTICTLNNTCTYLSWGANDGGQRGLLQPLGGAGGGAQELGGGGAEVGRSAKLRGMTAGWGGGRLNRIW